MKDAIISIAAGISQKGLIQKITERGFSVIGVDINPNAPSFKFCDECIIESTHNAEAIIEKLEHLTTKWNFCGILTQSSGVPVITTAKIAQHFNLCYVLPQSVENVPDKSKLLTILNTKGVSVPKVSIISRNEDINVDFSPPFFVKPSFCFRSHTAMTKVEEYSNLQKAIEWAMEATDTGTVNVEQFIKGTDILTIDWVYNKKIIHIASIEEINSGKPFYYGLGWKIPVSPEAEDMAKIISKQVIDALDVDYSLIMTSMKFNGENAYVYEVGLDLGGDGGSDLLSRSLNYDLLDNAITLAIGESPNSPKISAIPTYLRFILKSEIKSEPMKVLKYIKKHFNGISIEFDGLISSMNDEMRIAAVVFQSTNIEELNIRVEKFERWLKTKEILC